MCRLVCVFFLFSLFRVNAQQISLHFDDLDSRFKASIVFLNSNNLSSHTSGSAANLATEIVVDDIGRATFKESPNFTPGFYRIQSVPIGKEKYFYSAKLPNSTYVYLDANTQLEMEFASIANLHNGKLVTADPVNRALAAYLAKQFALTDSITNMLRAGQKVDFAAYRQQLLQLLGSEFNAGKEELVKLFIANELANIEVNTDPEAFNAAVPGGYMQAFSAGFKERPLYKTLLAEYEEAMSAVDLQLLSKIHLLNIDSSIAPNNLDAQTTVLHFWASWCKPCRYDNVSVAPGLLDKLKAAGVRLINISLDENFASWVKASKQDAVTWDNFKVTNDTRSLLEKELKIIGLPRVIIYRKDFMPVSYNCNLSDVDSILKRLQ